jgi:hydrogenase expression/formation protein HypE
LTEALLENCHGIRTMRDPTRGGHSAALHELAAASSAGIKLTESAIPLRNEVRAACEMLGLDPLYVASEGRLIAVVAPEQADRALEVMRNQRLGCDAAIIGQVVAEHPGVVTIRSALGGERIVSMLAGEQLPRIC